MRQPLPVAPPSDAIPLSCAESREAELTASAPTPLPDDKIPSWPASDSSHAEVLGLYEEWLEAGLKRNRLAERDMLALRISEDRAAMNLARSDGFAAEIDE